MLIMTKILAGIVTYNPDIRRLYENITSIVNQVHEVVIIDNASCNYKEIEQFRKIHNVKILHNSENKGIAKALDQILDYAKQNGYEWFLTLDQDSVMFSDAVKEYEKCFSYENVAIIAGSYINRGQDYKQSTTNDSQIIFTDFCITSGSLCNVNIINDVGGFAEQLFIDCVDTELCIRIIKNEYKILMINKPMFIHELGNSKEYNFIGKKITVFNESPIRHYYMSRNLLWLNREYGYKRAIRYYFTYILKIIFFEAEKRRKLKAYFWGTYDYFHNNFGKSLRTI